MKLLDRIPCNEALCPVISLCSTLLLHWNTPVRWLLPGLTKALNSGFEVGDVVYSSLCIVIQVGIRHMLAENLESLECLMRTAYNRLLDLGQCPMIRWVEPPMQFVSNLRSSPSSWIEVTILSGDVMDESEFMTEAVASNHKILLRNILRHKAALAYQFGYYQMAGTMYERMDLIGMVYENSVGGPSHYFYGAMIFYERYRTTRKVKHLKTARKHVKRLKWFEAVGSPNVFMFLVLIQGEELSLRSRDVRVLVVAYTKAIDYMKAEGFVHLEAMANERLSMILYELGYLDLSKPFLEQALNLYSDWGAIAKYEWLLVQRNLRFNTVNCGRIISSTDEFQLQYTRRKSIPTAS